jgi:hypothetical protein
MSKNITIQLDGVDVPITDAEELRTAEGGGGGSVVWVPEDETALGTLTATANGTYVASELGVYGFSVVVVNVPADNVTGTDTDGNDYTITLDGQGYLVETLVPSAILVSTPPAKVSYTAGETLDFSGMAVTAYDGQWAAYDTEDYPGGAVPFAELQLPVTVAAGSGSANVPVNWPRPGDGRILSCTFAITVTAGS